MATPKKSRGLATYNAKRDFTKTREPKGKVVRRKGFAFVVQKHAATRLHYDFRLELDGVMLSWAIPKGPNLDPSVKRLAVQTEDHPIAYNTFEGIIPKSEYGGGTVMVWDEGNWKPEGDPRAAYEKGHLAFELEGTKLRGKWHLVRTRRGSDDDKRQWLFFKSDDAEASTDAPDITETLPKSAVTGRDMDQIAAEKKRVWHSNKTRSGKAQEGGEEKPAPKKKAAAKTAAKKTSGKGPAKAGARTKSDANAPELAAMVRDLAPSIRFTNLDKVLYPEQGITKGAIAAYYALVCDAILPHLEKRPVTLVRCPDGPDGVRFFQKHAKVGVPKEIERITIAEDDGDDATYMMIDDRDGLLAAVQLGNLELHVWGSRIDDVERPDQLVFDLDPAPDVKWDQVVEGALAMRTLLEAHHLESWVKTTGGKGLHVVAPLKPSAAWDEAKTFCHDLAVSLASAAPKHFTASMAKSKRTGRIFVDYLRNGRGATAVAPYSTRARAGAPVATPITWKELEGGIDPTRLTLATVPERLRAAKKDAWAGFFEVKQKLGGVARGRKRAA